MTFFWLQIPVHCYLRRPYPKTLVPDDSGSRISKWGASECGYIFPSHHSNRSLCQWQENEGKETWISLSHQKCRKTTNVLSTMSLTIHLDLECDGCIGQVTLGIEGVLPLLLCIHSFQLQTSVVSKNKKGSLNWEKKKCLQDPKWLILWFEFRQFLCIIVEFVNRNKKRTPLFPLKQFHDLRKYMTLVFSVELHQNATTACFKSGVASPACSTLFCFC